MTVQATLCQFEHAGFASLGSIAFRLTNGDRVPAMAMALDGTEVVVPLPALARLFGLEPESGDGQMLRLIAESLRFVATIRLGDKLPSEVLTGEASWQPTDYHRQIASARLQLQLVQWIGAAASNGPGDGRITSQMLVVSVDDPAIRPRVQEGLRRAASALGIEGGGPAVAARIESLAAELAHIEALRERLLDRSRVVTKRLGRIAQDAATMAAARRETLFQVLRLLQTATLDLLHQFEEVDAQTLDILVALRQLEQQPAFLRPGRDRLSAALLEWDPVLTGWEDPPAKPEEADTEWRAVEDLYRFLAPRYMAVQEWQSVASRSDRARAVVTW